MQIPSLFTGRLAGQYRMWTWGEISRGLQLLAILCLACCFQARADNNRVALVIGNSAYPMSPLQNPRNDATAMAALLTEAGFVVDQQLDTNLGQLRAAVERFGKAIRDPQVKFGMFYYAGHGLQQDWRNYLVPVSADIRTDADVVKQTVDVSQLLRYMENIDGRSFLVVLDACRDDPFAGAYRPSAKGLSQFDAPVGSLLAFATSPGNVARDGEGRNGLYTSYLLREFAVRGTRLEDAFKRVRLNVRLASKGQQIPWESTSLEEDVYLFPAVRKELTEAEKDQLLEREISLWQRVKNSADPEVLASFIRQYPSGNASELAQARMNRLLGAISAREVQRMQEGSRRELELAESARRAAEAQAAADRAELQRNQIQQAEQTRLQAEQAREAPAKLTATQQGVAIAPVQASSVTRDEIDLAPTPFFKGYAEHRRRYAMGDQFNFRVVDMFNKKGTQNLVMKVTQIEADADRVLFNDGEFASDLMGNVVNNRVGSFSTPRQFYPAELFVGKKWETRFKQSRPGGTAYTFQYRLKVAARETITVPAGTFDAYRIEARGMNLELGASIERNIWVTPGINADIAHDYTVRLRNGTLDWRDRTELVSFQQAGQR